MIHSSTSKGVIYTDLGTDYYVRTYACAGKVGQYHAKLSRKQKSGEKKSKNKKETKPTAPEALPREIPVEIHVDELDRVLSSASGRDSGEAPAVRQAEAPVTAKAENNVTSKSETKNSPAPVTTPTPVKAIGSQNNTSRKPAPSLTEPTVEDARSSVLNSIKEKEL